MKKRFVPPQSWYEAMEEERKVKRNLSRLMQSFQHIHSDRSGNSLRNLVTEIEFFNPSDPSKEVRSCKCQTRGEQSIRPDEYDKEIARTSISSKSKKAGILITTTNLTKRRDLSYKNETDLNETNKNTSTTSKSHRIDKPKNLSLAEISSERKQHFLDKKVLKNKLQKDSTNNQRKLDLGWKPKTKQLLREENKMAVSNRQMLNKISNTPKHKNIHVSDKVKSIAKKSNSGQTQQCERDIVQTSVYNRNVNTMSTPESSKVKKLTKYWNKMLNNDIYQFKSEIRSTKSSVKSSKSLECLSGKTPSKHKEKHSTDCIKSTESQENGEISDHSEKYITRTNHKNFLTNTSPTTSILTELNSEVEEYYETKNKSLKELQQSRSEIENVNTNQASKTLERLLRYINIFPNSSLLSDEIRLPKSVKALISLLTATLSCDQYEQFWNEISEFTLVHSNYANSNDRELIVSPHMSDHGGSGDCFSPQSDRVDDLGLPNENLLLVSNALKFISLCKEVLWTMYISNPVPWQSRQTGTFSFVYEQTVVLEETDSEFSEDGKGEEEEEEEVTIKDLINAAANILGEVTLSCLQCFRVNWPNSMESVIRTIYYTIVSTLVWWVIIKEIFYAK